MWIRDDEDEGSSSLWVVPAELSPRLGTEEPQRRERVQDEATGSTRMRGRPRRLPVGPSRVAQPPVVEKSGTSADEAAMRRKRRISVPAEA